MRVLLALLMVGVTAGPLWAQNGQANSLVEGARGAKKIVLATVTDVQSTFDVNDYGDRLIVSNALMHVEETLKGSHDLSVTVTVEGGTVGELTLRVSDMPVIAAGDHVVVFLDDTNRGGHVPHGRGYGVFKLNATNQVEGTSISLDDIKSAVDAATR